MKRMVIVGATSAMAEHCARLWVRRAPVDMTLVGRDKTKIERVAADLHVRSPQSVFHVRVGDFVDPIAIRRLVDDVVAEGDIDTVLIAQGALSDQSACQTDLSACRTALEINGLSPVLYAEAFAHHMGQRGRGTVALIGSVAGDRGRKTNYVYGAAKGLMTNYAQGLQHRFAGTGVNIVLIKAGPTDTPMTAHLKAKGASLAPVEEVAHGIVDAIERGRPIAYVPKRWGPIMWVIRHLPASLFNKLNI